MAKMACPVCGLPSTQTYDTRQSQFNEIKRRRKCDAGHKFTTYESIDRVDASEEIVP